LDIVLSVLLRFTDSDRLPLWYLQTLPMHIQEKNTLCRDLFCFRLVQLRREMIVRFVYN
jgi:hypothetical protein